MTKVWPEFVVVSSKFNVDAKAVTLATVFKSVVWCPFGNFFATSAYKQNIGVSSQLFSIISWFRPCEPYIL